MTKKELKEVIEMKNRVIEKLSNMYESRSKGQDSEIRRLNIILNNYEVKLKITVKED
tara:strand:+ start:846 stop:1016 length:171 start_codon:yes stop_codon:yes gene_type:complete